MHSESMSYVEVSHRVLHSNVILSHGKESMMDLFAYEYCKEN